MKDLLLQKSYIKKEKEKKVATKGRKKISDVICVLYIHQCLQIGANWNG
jgi:hypothetical protein